MGNSEERKIELLKDIGKLRKSIEDEVDWFIASFMEKNPKRKFLSRYMFGEKQKELKQLAGEIYERNK
jgi:hypothetical protein